MPDHLLDKDIEATLCRYTRENSSNAIYWISQGGDIVFANSTASEKLGYSRSEFLALTIFDVDPNIEKQDWPDRWQKLKTQKFETLETSHRKKDGSILPVEVAVHHVTAGQQEFHCAFARDISDHKAIERLLRDSEERFRLTLDATSNGMWDRNLKTGEVQYGANWASSLGFQDEDLEQGKITWQSLLHPEDKDRTLKAMQDHLEGKTPVYISEFRLLNADRQWQWMLGRGKVVQFDENGKPTRFVGTQTNINERKEAEEKLKKQTEKNRIFAYSIAHDLKNPAISIHGLTERLYEKCDEFSREKIKSYCLRILQASQQIEDLVTTLNTFVSTKSTPIKVEEISIRDLTGSIYKEFSSRIRKRNINWHGCTNKSLIKGDRISLLRVLRNFVDNALKYGGNDLTSISIEYEELPSHHVLSVRDDGIGLSDTDTADIFSPFERKSTSKGISGTGLGLAIVKEIAKQHSGSVWMESCCNGGIKFCFAISKHL